MAGAATAGTAGGIDALPFTGGETEDDQHVVDAIENLDPVAVTSLFPLSAAAARAVHAAGIANIEIGTLPGLGDPHLSIGELRVEHLVSRGHRQIAFAYTGIQRWRALGDYWFGGVVRAARARDLPRLAVADVTVDNAAEVVRSWVRDGVTAVCAQSDEIGCLVDWLKAGDPGRVGVGDDAHLRRLQPETRMGIEGYLHRLGLLIHFEISAVSVSPRAFE